MKHIIGNKTKLNTASKKRYNGSISPLVTVYTHTWQSTQDFYEKP